MENLFDFEGDSVDYRLFTSSTDLKGKLITHSKSFIQLYDQLRDRLQRTSESFTQTAVRVDEMHVDNATQGLLSVLGGMLGAACGAFAGGVWGTLGAVGAATYISLCGDITVVSATVGLVGSLFGGVVGGSFSGTVGGIAVVSAAASGRSFNGIVSYGAWFTIGFATGGAIGRIYGGTVGAAGGAIGGAFGALHATSFAVGVFGVIDSKDQKKETKKMDIIQKAGQDFLKMIKPLVEELKTIKMISDKMTSSVAVRSVAEQTAKTLAAVTVMKRTISESPEDLTKCLASVEEAATPCRQVTEELKKTRAEVEKLLVSLTKP